MTPSRVRKVCKVSRIVVSFASRGQLAKKTARAAGFIAAAARSPRRCGAAGRGGPGLAVLDQREVAAAVVEHARGPELAIDGGKAAEDVVAAARVRAWVHGPVVAGAAQDQDLATVG